MIQPKELRIGNLIKHNNREYVVNGLNKRRIELTSSDNIVFSTSRLDLIKPIPITEDVLLKSGGVKESTYIHFERLSLRMFYDGERWHCSLGDDDYGIIFRAIRHIHEFQNMVQGLSGEELTINLK